MENAATKRIQRSLRDAPERRAIYEYLSSPEGRSRLKEAADRGSLPLTVVSNKLVEIVGRDSLSTMATKQFCGLAASAILAEEGYEVDQGGVRARGDSIFSTGSVYKRRQPMPTGTNDNDLLRRFLDALTADEIGWALEYLRSKQQPK